MLPTESAPDLSICGTDGRELNAAGLHIAPLLHRDPLLHRAPLLHMWSLLPLLSLCCCRRQRMILSDLSLEQLRNK